MGATNALRAHEIIKERIITARMKPGAMIDEGALVEELGYGRTPIREACKRLEVERLVVVLPRRGMYVAEVTLAELRELEEIRLELEALCARLAVERMPPAMLDDLHRAMGELNGLVIMTGENHDGFLRSDLSLHRLVWRASQNELLEAECQRMHEYSMRMWYLFVDRLQVPDVHGECFAEIAAAVGTGDQQRADQAMRDHIRQFGEALRSQL